MDDSQLLPEPGDPGFEQLVRLVHHQSLHLVQGEQGRVMLQHVHQSVGRRHEDVVLHCHLLVGLDLGEHVSPEAGLGAQGGALVADLHGELLAGHHHQGAVAKA